MRNNTIRLLGTMLLLTAATGALYAEDDTLPVFVLAGQSNMGGVGKVQQLPPELRAEQPNVLMFAAGKWVPLEPGGRFGPELTFGAEMAAKLGRPVGIVKFAVSGSHLVYNWLPGVKGNYYAKAVDTVNQAKASRKVTIAGMCWMQGERDSLYPGASKKYAANLDLLVKSARKDYGAPDMPFVLGRVNPAPPRYKFVKVVRKAQQELGLPKTAWIDCDDLPRLPDKVHYNTKGQTLLGRKFADAMLKLMGVKEE